MSKITRSAISRKPIKQNKNKKMVSCVGVSRGYHGPACMCHCIFFRINPRVSKHHAFHLHRATWWQLGLSSREDICVSLCQLLVRALAGQVPLRLPAELQQQRRLHAGTSVLIGGGPLQISENYSRGQWHK